MCSSDIFYVIEGLKTQSAAFLLEINKFAQNEIPQQLLFPP